MRITCRHWVQSDKKWKKQESLLTSADFFILNKHAQQNIPTSWQEELYANSTVYNQTQK